MLDIVLCFGLLLEDAFDPFLHPESINHRCEDAARVAYHERSLEQEYIAVMRDVSLLEPAICSCLMAKTQPIANPHACFHLSQPGADSEGVVESGRKVVF